MKFDNKIILSDIDGTFLDKDMRIVDRNIDAINYFKENGGLFTFATGRNERILEPEVVKIANAPIVCCNGAYIYDFEAERRHNETCIAPGPTIQIIKTVLESFPDVYAIVNVGRKYYLVGEKAMLRKDIFRLTDEDVLRVPLDEVPPAQWYTVVFSGDIGQLDLVEKYLHVAGDDLYHISHSWSDLLEVNNIRATKGNAACELKHLCETRYKIPQYTLYGIGDYENDTELLRGADIAACPENAIDSIKELADVIVCSHNDGAIAGLIEYIDANM